MKLRAGGKSRAMAGAGSGVVERAGNSLRLQPL